VKYNVFGAVLKTRFAFVLIPFENMSIFFWYKGPIFRVTPTCRRVLIIITYTSNSFLNFHASRRCQNILLTGKDPFLLVRVVRHWRWLVNLDSPGSWWPQIWQIIYDVIVYVLYCILGKHIVIILECKQL